jgi:hypothetical protein
MCNLYGLKTGPAEIADLFNAIVGQVANAGGGEVYPGYPGLVVTGGELWSMTWDFPLALKRCEGTTAHAQACQQHAG